MDTESYRFTVGDTIDRIAVSDGTVTYPSNTLLAEAPVERMDRELRDHGLALRKWPFPTFVY